MMSLFDGKLPSEQGITLQEARDLVERYGKKYYGDGRWVTLEHGQRVFIDSSGTFNPHGPGNKNVHKHHEEPGEGKSGGGAASKKGEIVESLVNGKLRPGDMRFEMLLKDDKIHITDDYGNQHGPFESRYEAGLWVQKQDRAWKEKQGKKQEPGEGKAGGGAAKEKKSGHSLSKSEWEARREFLLDEIDAWQSGKKATPGQPADGKNYPLVMRENVKRLEKELHDIGGWGNKDYEKSGYNKDEPKPEKSASDIREGDKPAEEELSEHQKIIKRINEIGPEALAKEWVEEARKRKAGEKKSLDQHAEALVKQFKENKDKDAANKEFQRIIKEDGLTQDEGIALGKKFQKLLNYDPKKEAEKKERAKERRANKPKGILAQMAEEAEAKKKNEPPPPPEPAPDHSNKWHKGREEVFAQMRKLDETVQRNWDVANSMRPRHGELALGSGDFDYVLKAEVGSAYLRALNKGKNPEEAYEEAKKEGTAIVKNWNEKGHKGRVSINSPHELKRWEGAGESAADHVHAMFKAGLPKEPTPEPAAKNEPASSAPKLSEAHQEDYNKSAPNMERQINNETSNNRKAIAIFNNLDGNPPAVQHALIRRLKEIAPDVIDYLNEEGGKRIPYRLKTPFKEALDQPEKHARTVTLEEARDLVRYAQSPIKYEDNTGKPDGWKTVAGKHVLFEGNKPVTPMPEGKGSYKPEEKQDGPEAKLYDPPTPKPTQVGGTAGMRAETGVHKGKTQAEPAPKMPGKAPSSPATASGEQGPPIDPVAAQWLSQGPKGGPQGKILGEDEQAAAKPGAKTQVGSKGVPDPDYPGQMTKETHLAAPPQTGEKIKPGKGPQPGFEARRAKHQQRAAKAEELFNAMTEQERQAHKAERDAKAAVHNARSQGADPGVIAQLMQAWQALMLPAGQAKKAAAKRVAAQKAGPSGGQGQPPSGASGSSPVNPEKPKEEPSPFEGWHAQTQADRWLRHRQGGYYQQEGTPKRYGVDEARELIERMTGSK